MKTSLYLMKRHFPITKERGPKECSKISPLLDSLGITDSWRHSIYQICQSFLYSQTHKYEFYCNILNFPLENHDYNLVTFSKLPYLWTPWPNCPFRSVAAKWSGTLLHASALPVTSFNFFFFLYKVWIFPFYSFANILHPDTRQCKLIPLLSYEPLYKEEPDFSP